MARGTGLPAPVTPMLASPGRGRLPADDRFTYEYKYDGYRAVLRVAPSGDIVLTSRNDKDITAEFAMVGAGLGDALGGRAAVLDGELVVVNEHGQPEFALMQERRGRYQQGLPTGELPARFLVFDLLRLGGDDLTGETYEARRGRLSDLDLPDPDLLAVVPAFPHAELAARGLTPRDLLDRAARAGYEGLISKRRASRYYPGRRTAEWLKHPLIRTQEVIVCGWRPGRGRRDAMIGGLLLGAHDPGTGELVYLGDVGTGFTEAALRAMRDRLEPLARRTTPFPSGMDERGVHWVEPVVVGEVVYRQFTRSDRRLRHAAWRGLRPDRDPGEVLAPAPTLGDPPPKPGITVRVGDRRLTLSDLDEPLYPDGTTRGEVVNYYSRIAPVLLPHLAGRPLALPAAPAGAPSWVDDPARPVVTDLPTLVWVVDLPTVELRVPLWTPVLELRPAPGASIADCCRAAGRFGPSSVTTTGDGGLYLWFDGPPPVVEPDDRVLVEEVTGTVPVPYSLRAGAEPAVCVPLTRAELEHPPDLAFTPEDVLDRFGPGPAGTGG